MTSRVIVVKLIKLITITIKINHTKLKLNASMACYDIWYEKNQIEILQKKREKRKTDNNIENCEMRIL